MAEPKQAVRRPTVKVWYITASHKGLEWVNGQRHEVPFGTSHTRKLGSNKTACGLPALNWPIFWDVNMRQVTGLCEICIQHQEGTR